MKPTLEQIDKIRADGFRPDVVGCIIHDKKILMLYKKEYGLWLLPQGRVNNLEEAEIALTREMTEELGSDFVAHFKPDYSYIGEDKMEFTPDKYDMNELFLDNGKHVKMIGKAYMFYVIQSDTDILDITKTEFDEYFWLEYHPACFLARKIYQQGRKRITISCLNLLKDKGFLS